jgi:hypothetical protein
MNNLKRIANSDRGCPQPQPVHLQSIAQTFKGSEHFNLLPLGSAAVGI